MKYDQDRIKKQIQAEADMYEHFGPGRIWYFLVREIFRNDTESAREFMLSKAGGFNAAEINRIVSQKETNKTIYNKERIYT